MTLNHFNLFNSGYLIYFVLCLVYVQLTTHELRPGGADEPVLEENKHDYIELMVRWRLDRGVAEQMQALLKGFVEVRLE